MSHILTPKEIYERMKEWRNFKKLHAQARQRVRLLEEMVRMQKEQNQTQAELIETQNRQIEAQSLLIEELRRMVFGKKKTRSQEKNKDDASPDDVPRKPALRDSSSYHRPTPDTVTKEEYHCIDTCPDCQTPLTRTKIAVFYEEDIILPIADKKPLKTVTRHTAEKGWCPSCKKWIAAYPLPPTASVIGKNVKLYLCYLSILIRLSFEQIRTLLKTTYQFDISDGEISSILEKEARTLLPEYKSLKDRIRNQQGAHYDETAWKVQKETQGNYAWVMTGIETPDAVFDCGKSRGKGVAESLKGSADHIGITDDYGAYKKLFKTHQLCWAHPLRKFRELAESDALNANTRQSCRNTYEAFSVLYADLRMALTRPFDRDERAAVYTKLSSCFDQVAFQSQNDPKKLATLKESLRKNKESYFPCLLHTRIPADNNKAERALRHLVLKRKTSFGSKTQRGAETTSILASVLLSLFWTKPANFFQEYMKMREV
jgi:transposase